MVNRNVLAFLEGNSVKLISRVKDPIFEYVVQFEVRLNFGLIQIVLRLAHLFGVELPVPRLQSKSAFLRVDDILNILALDRRLRGRARHQGIHEFQGGLGSFCHLVAQLPRRVVWISEQLRSSRSQLRDARNGIAGIVSVAPLRTVPGFPEDGFTRRPYAQRGEVRLLRRVLQRENITLLLAALRGLCGCGDLGVAQAGESGLVRR